MLYERSRPYKDAKKWDLALVSVMGVFLFAAYLIACLDVRFGWSSPFPFWMQIAGLAAAILSYDVILLWSMVSNAYFTAILRIQDDRQHTVASGGPDQFVRHPDYVGTILCYLATPFLLGSPWALIAASLAGILLVVRTALENKILQAELPGYKEYALQTHYRLIPGLW